jgi:hypothetical protein
MKLIASVLAFVGMAKAMHDPNDGGSCEISSRFEAYTAQRDYFFNFTDHRRHRFNHAGALVWNLDETLLINDGRFNRIVVDGYSGAFTLSNSDEDKKKEVYGSPLKNTGNDGGWFFYARVTDRSYLRFHYGNHFGRSKLDGFKPKIGYLMTWLYISNPSLGGCVNGKGNSFQALIMISTQNKLRLAMNFGWMNYPDDGTLAGLSGDARPVTGWGFSYPATKLIGPTTGNFYIAENNGNDFDGTVDSVTGLAKKTWMWKDIDNLVLSSPLDNQDVSNTVTCDDVEHCRCPSIVVNSQMTFYGPDGTQLTTLGAVHANFEFSGRCSLDADTMNYGDYHTRYQFCFIKAKDDCNFDGKTPYAYISSPNGNANAGQQVVVAKFFCAIENSNIPGPPRWQRNISQMERGLNSWVNGNKDRKNKNKKRVRGNKTTKPTETMALKCGFYCQNPSVWAATNINVNGNSVDINTDRDGTWVCKDFDGVVLAAGADVPKGGYCMLTCALGGGPGNVSQTLRCDNWYKTYGYKNYNKKDVSRFIKETKKNGGWKCEE